MRRATVLASACVVLLSACTTEPPMPTGLSAAQLSGLAQPTLDAQWNAIAPLVGGLERPTVDGATFVSPDDQAAAIAGCLEQNGFPGGSAMVFSADGEVIQEGPVLDTEGYHLFQYICEAEYPIDPRIYGALSTSQLNYLYDYYLNWTIPCLYANDYPVPSLPSRKEFLRTGSPDWTPYYNASASGGIVPPSVLRGRCGVVPAGLFPPEYVAALRDGQDRVNGWGRYVDR